MLPAAMLLATLSVSAQEGITETTFHVSGNCGMCKTRIEKALSVKEVKYAKWDKTKKVVKIAYASSEISLDSLKHRVALVGHDTEPFRAPDSVYAVLPECCLYRDKNVTH
jgi:hypothetical protein